MPKYGMGEYHTEQTSMTIALTIIVKPM